MVDNQHKKIKGYRNLSEEEIVMMNTIKELAEEVGNTIEYLENRNEKANGYEPDKRWLAIAKTDLQKGFMALVRSVAKPESF